MSESFEGRTKLTEVDMMIIDKVRKAMFANLRRTGPSDKVTAEKNIVPLLKYCAQLEKDAKCDFVVSNWSPKILWVKSWAEAKRVIEADGGEFYQTEYGGQFDIWHFKHLLGRELGADYDELDDLGLIMLYRVSQSCSFFWPYDTHLIICEHPEKVVVDEMDPDLTCYITFADGTEMTHKPDKGIR